MIHTPRAVVDTNVLVSGLFHFLNAPSAHILEAIRAQKLVLVSSPAILSEVENVINRDRIVAKTQMTKEERTEFMDMLIERCEVIEGKLVLTNVSRDSKDNKFLACGAEARVDYIVTGDEDLLVLKEYEGITVISPREFVELL